MIKLKLKHALALVGGLLVTLAIVILALMRRDDSLEGVAEAWERIEERHKETVARAIQKRQDKIKIIEGDTLRKERELDGRYRKRALKLSKEIETLTAELNDDAAKYGIY